MADGREQGVLFELQGPALDSARPSPEHETLAAELPPSLRFGGMSWSYPGWKDVVYGEKLSPKQLTPKHLAEHGLTAYGKHPLLRAVEIDRSYYEPLALEVLHRFASQVPDDFKFVVKAHEDCVLQRFPPHARYGKKAGQANPRYLDAAYTGEAVFGPLAGLGSKLGALLFQFPPHAVGEPEAFAQALHRFLEQLPRATPCAVELRNPELLTPAYAAALADVGALHCHNVWTSMPPAMVQARRIPPRARNPLLIRWLMRQGDTYEAAGKRYAPFNRIVEEDLGNRADVARLVAKATAHDVPAMVLVDNKAEGCAPESIVRLARAVVEERARG